MSTLGDGVASVPLQRVRGQDSQAAEQQGAGTRPADQDVAATKAIRTANPVVLRARERIVLLSTRSGGGNSGQSRIRDSRAGQALFADVSQGP